MLGLTPLGIVHTAISLIAVAAGFASIARDKQISTRTRLGQVYLVTTLLTCLTAFGIYRHGGFGPPHVVGVVTIVTLGIGVLAERSGVFGNAGPYVQVVSFSATLLFHMIPAVTETTTRLPPGNPLVASEKAPVLRVAYLILFVVFVAGSALQVRWLRARLSRPGAAGR